MRLRARVHVVVRLSERKRAKEASPVQLVSMADRSSERVFGVAMMLYSWDSSTRVHVYTGSSSGELSNPVISLKLSAKNCVIPRFFRWKNTHGKRLNGVAKWNIRKSLIFNQFVGLCARFSIFSDGKAVSTSQLFPPPPQLLPCQRVESGVRPIAPCSDGLAIT